jgi:hypothetical protein
MRRTCLIMLALATSIAAGCAYTEIEKSPDGSFRYVSTRDSSIEELHVARLADGSLELDVNGAAGRASPVIDAQTEFIRAMLEAAFAAAARAGH